MKKLLFLFVFFWVVFSFFLFFLKFPINSSFQHNVVFFSVVFVFLALASFFMMKLFPFLQKLTKPQASLLFVLNLTLFILIYGVVWLCDGKSGLFISSIASVNLLIWATLFGFVLSSAVQRTAELIPICITACIADIMSVFRGPTSIMVENLTEYYDTGMQGMPPFIDFVVIKVAIPNMTILQPLFGVTDWVFVALLSASLYRLKVSSELFTNHGVASFFASLPVATSALFVGIIVTQISGLYLPAMLFISFFFLLFLFFRVKVYKDVVKKDVVYSIIFPALVVAVFLLADFNKQ